MRTAEAACRAQGVPAPPRRRHGREFDLWCLRLVSTGYSYRYAAGLSGASERAVRYAAAAGARILEREGGRE